MKIALASFYNAIRTSCCSVAIAQTMKAAEKNASVPRELQPFGDWRRVQPLPARFLIRTFARSCGLDERLLTSHPAFGHPLPTSGRWRFLKFDRSLNFVGSKGP